MLAVKPLGTRPLAFYEPPAPHLSLSGSSAQLWTSSPLYLAATAPNLSFSGSTAQLETKVRDELAATAPNLSLAGSSAELYTKLRDELAANAPNLALSGSTAQLTTSAGLELLATAPNLALSGSTASIVTEDLAVRVPPSGPAVPGELVAIEIDSSAETLTCSAGSVAIESQDAVGNLTFYAPHPQSFGDQTLNFGTAITFTLTKGAETADFTLIINADTGTTWGEITSIDPQGIYADDVGVNVGDYVYAQNFTGDAVLDPATGLVSNTALSSLEYALYDGTWSGFATENFPDQGLFLSATAPNLSISGSTAQIVTAGALELAATAPNLALSGNSAQLVTASRLELAATAPNLSLSGSTAQLVTDAELLLEATAPNLSLSGSSAQLITGTFLNLEANAPNLALSGSSAQLVTDAELLLETTAPNLALSGNSAQLVTGSTLALNATAPNLSLSGSSAQLVTDLELFLNATAPNLSLSGSSAWLVTGNLDFIEPENTIIFETKPMATIIHDGVSKPYFPDKDPDSTLIEGVTLSFLADGDTINSYSILINGTVAANGDTVDGLTLVGRDYDLAKTITLTLAGGTIYEQYEITIRYSTTDIPSDDKSVYVKVFNQ